MSRRLTPLLPLAGLLAGLLTLASCDAGLDGERFENQPPRTYLAVRDTSLAENLCTRTPEGAVVCSQDDDLFTSTVFVAWSGTDPDGFVVGYDIRFYDDALRPGPEELWSFTTSRDTIILLPIPAGQQTAKVVFEARAIDNEGLKDPTPARTVFPIINTPPSIRFIPVELPGAETWTIFSFGIDATDPDGAADLAAVEVALNGNEFVSLPPGTRFVTFVADGAQPGDQTADARIYLGRGFANSGLVAEGLRLDAQNSIQIRARDRSGATSPVRTYPDADLDQTWFVRQPRSNILLVNDYRSVRAHEVMPFHRATLEGYTGGAAYDEWDLSLPAVGNRYAHALPPVATPTLRELLKLWDYIYWVSDNIIEAVQGNNLALVSTLAEDFLASGGKFFVQVPFTRPFGGEFELDNPAYDLLPAESIVTMEGSGVPPSLAIPSGAEITAIDPVPGTGRLLPTLKAVRLTFALPYEMNFTTSAPLSRGEFVDRDNNNEPWTGAPFVSSMDRDRRVALLALQLYDRNRYNFTGTDGSLQDPCLAVQYLLEGLSFPGSPGTCPAPAN
jgi:hypothetical protein